MDYTGSIYRLIDRAEDEMKEYAQRVKQLSCLLYTSVQPTSPPAGCQMGYGQAVQDRQQCKVPAGRGSHESGAGDSGCLLYTSVIRRRR